MKRAAGWILGKCDVTPLPWQALQTLHLRLRVTTALISVALLPTVGRANTLLVPSQHATIQAALDLAASGDTVLVAPGTYSDTVTREIQPYTYTFCARIPPNVVLRSEAGPEKTTIHIPFSPASPLSYAVIAYSYPWFDGRGLEGFTIRADPGVTGGLFVRYCFEDHLVIKDCIFEGIQAGENDDHRRGGAIYSDNSGLLVESTLFRDCHADEGGAIYFDSASTVHFQDCQFSRCSGGACVFLLEDAETSLNYLHCLFENNEGGDVLTSTYGNYFMNHAFLNVSDCDFVSTSGGPAIQGNKMTSVDIVGNRFTGTDVPIRIVGSLARLTEAKVERNVIRQSSEPLEWTIAHGTFTENIFVNCTGGAASAAKFKLIPGGAEPTCNVDVAANLVLRCGANPLFIVDDLNGFHSSCNVDWENTGDATNVPGFIPIDPQFCDFESGNLTVAESSPCLIENSAICSSNRLLEVGCPDRGTTTIGLLTEPPGLAVTVSGVTRSTPMLHSGISGNQVVIGAPSEQPNGPGQRYVWTSWDDGQSNEHEIVIGETTSITTASFTPQVLLTTLASPGGEAFPGEEWHFLGETAVITAVSGPLHQFSMWEGLGFWSYEGSDNPATVLMNGPMIETAIFTPNQYPVAMIAGVGGTVTPASGTYSALSQVEIRAIPDQIHTFAGWIGTGPGSYTGANPVATISVEGAIEEHAYFASVYAGYDFTISTSDVDPHQNVATPLGNWRQVYLWATCLDRGLAAFEAEVSSELTVTSFFPLNGILNVGVDKHLLLAIPGCPTGTEADYLLGYWYVNDTGGSVCLIPSTETGNLAAVDCDTPNSHLWANPVVTGFTSSSPEPCVTGTNGCLNPSTDPEDPATDVPTTSNWVTSFAPPRPNPFARTVDLNFVLQRGAAVQIDLFDVQGRRVRKLCDASYESGAHAVTWDGRDDGGLNVPSGIFFARFQAGDFVQVRKLVRLEDR